MKTDQISFWLSNLCIIKALQVILFHVIGRHNLALLLFFEQKGKPQRHSRFNIRFELWYFPCQQIKFVVAETWDNTDTNGQFCEEFKLLYCKVGGHKARIIYGLVELINIAPITLQIIYFFSRLHQPIFLYSGIRQSQCKLNYPIFYILESQPITQISKQIIMTTPDSTRVYESHLHQVQSLPDNQIGPPSASGRFLSYFQKQKHMRFTLIMVATAISILLVVALFGSKKQSQFLSILTSDGQRVELPYQNSKLFKPALMTQPGLNLIKFRDVSKLQQLVFKINSKQDKVKFAGELFMNWFQENKTLFRMEYLYLNHKYNLDKVVTEKRICVLAPFRNLLNYGEDGSFHLFLKSLNGQNYSNYVVYMIDDASSDNSTDVILSQLHKYPRLNNRIRIIKNEQSIGALANRDSTTRNHCRSGDIVMDIDGDDSLIGKQVFNLFNRLYHDNPQAWFVYTNFISIRGEEEGDGRVISLNISKSKPGPCRTIHSKYFLSNSYRTQIAEWVTSQLRSYLWDLYIKIPLDYVLELDTGRYYIKASDRFVMYALTELANINHTFYFEEFSYFYYQPNFKALQHVSCILPIIFYCEAQARILTPLMPLESLQDDVQRTKFYSIPRKILEYYISKKRNYLLCKEKIDGISGLFEEVEEI